MVNPLEQLEAVTHILVDQCSDLKDLKQFICLHEESLIILPAYLDRRSKKSLIRFLEANQLRYYDMALEGYFQLRL